MNKQQKQVSKAQLKSEKQVLRELKENYRSALTDVNSRLKKLSERDQIESVIYQKQYQEALKLQIDSALDVLNTGNLQTIEAFLKLSYTNGFIGTLYDISKNIMPMVLPIPQRQMAESVKYGAGHIPISARLYKNVRVFASQIQTAVSTGIAAQIPWRDIAIQIAASGQSSLNHSYLIARTEGARVQSEAATSAQTEAKKRGCDLVKQWDATLDGRTRPDHVALDGQIREIGEPFEVNGHEAQGPCQFGIGSEDIQCRCKAVTRARWAVDGDYQKRDQETGLTVGQQSETYEDWKQRQYMED